MRFTGRTGRGSYIVAQLVLIPLLYVSGGPMVLAIWTLDHDFPEKDIPKMLRGIVLAPQTAWIVAAVAGVAFAILVIANLAFAVRRLHDLDFSGWFLLLWPVLTFLVAPSDYIQVSDASVGQIAFEAVLMMVPGIVGPNAYGADPRTYRGPEAANGRPPPA